MRVVWQIKDDHKFANASPFDRWDLFPLPWVWVGLGMPWPMEYSESDAVPVAGVDFKRAGSFYLASLIAYFHYYFNELIFH